MEQQSIRGGICHSLYQYANANNKYMKDYDTNKESPYLQYWDVTNLYGWVISQKFSVKWIHTLSGSKIILNLKKVA